jgi:hypothetical protein
MYSKYILHNRTAKDAEVEESSSDQGLAAEVVTDDK